MKSLGSPVTKLWTYASRVRSLLPSGESFGQMCDGTSNQTDIHQTDDLRFCDVLEDRRRLRHCFEVHISNIDTYAPCCRQQAMWWSLLQTPDMLVSWVRFLEGRSWSKFSWRASLLFLCLYHFIITVATAVAIVNIAIVKVKNTKHVVITRSHGSVRVL